MFRTYKIPFGHSFLIGVRGFPASCFALRKPPGLSRVFNSSVRSVVHSFFLREVHV